MPDHAEPLCGAAGGFLRAWLEMGAHPARRHGEEGWQFRVWAPAAAAVSVVGDWNGWDPAAHPCAPRSDGIWECFIPGLRPFACYKFFLRARDGRLLYKADPYAFHAETRPGTASKLYDIGGYPWKDAAWLRYRRRSGAPWNLYELHLGGWRRTGEGALLSYRDIADLLVPYVKRMGYTHVSLLPVAEHPADASLGFACTGWFAATSRFGTPHDLMYLVDACHQAGVGVVLSLPSLTIPEDAHGLADFDGDRCYEGEAAAPRRFDLGRTEARGFLLSAALFWLTCFHMDGLRLREDDAPQLRRLAAALAPMTTDTPVLPPPPVRPEEVRPGCFSARRAAHLLRLAAPGEKHTVMGDEFGQERPWVFYQSLDWHLLARTEHRQTQDFYRAANALFLQTPDLWGSEPAPPVEEAEPSALLRRGPEGTYLALLHNPTPVRQADWRVGLPDPGPWRVVLHSDWARFGGEVPEDDAPFWAEARPAHGQIYSAAVSLPPHAAILIQKERDLP